jgi:hypothetical protein
MRLPARAQVEGGGVYIGGKFYRSGRAVHFDCKGLMLPLRPDRDGAANDPAHQLETQDHIPYVNLQYIYQCPHTKRAPQPFVAVSIPPRHVRA